jgi:hypothetical protein
VKIAYLGQKNVFCFEKLRIRIQIKLGKCQEVRNLGTGNHNVSPTPITCCNGQNSYTVYRYELMTYTARTYYDVGKSITRASGRALGPGNQDFFEPCEIAQDVRQVPFGAQKS